MVEALADTTDVLGTGDMGIANTTPSTAVVAALTGLAGRHLTGRGTGIDDGQLARKIAVVEQALAVNRPDPPTPGRAGQGGRIRDRRHRRRHAGGCRPAQAGRRRRLHFHRRGPDRPSPLPGGRQYVIAAHRSAEPGHRAMHARLGKEPLLDLGLRLGEGTGAALAMNLVEPPSESSPKSPPSTKPTFRRPKHETIAGRHRFLTIVPIPGTGARPRRTLPAACPGSRSSACCGRGGRRPGLGAVQVVPPMVAAAALVIVLLGFSGCLHLDGLSDTADGFLSSATASGSWKS